MRHCLLFAPSLSMQLISLPDSVRIQTCSEPAWTVTLVQCWTSVLQMTRGMGLLCSVYGISNQDDFVKSQGWGSHRAGILLTLSVAEIKYWPKNTLGKKWVYFYIYFTIHQRWKPKQELKVGTETETTEKHCLLACSIWLVFFYSPGPPAQGCFSPQWLPSPPSIADQGNVLPMCPQVNMMVSISRWLYPVLTETRIERTEEKLPQTQTVCYGVTKDVLLSRSMVRG